MKTPVVARENVIPRRIVVCLGVAQVIAWGTMHYLVSVFGPSIQAETGWQAGFVYGGFSCALVVMGIASASAGRWIDRRGGRAAMMAGCWIGAAGCATLAVAHHGAVYYLGWILLGLAMRLALAGQRIGILTVNLVPCSLLCLAFAAALAAGTTLPGAALFTLLYGAGNGMATVMRGAIPLALFDARQYGRIVGGVLKPVFILCAGAPVVFALAIRNLGYPGTLALMLVMSVALLAAAVALHRRHRKEASP